ncbi:MAG: dihydrolipoyl dehydrogenase [bacterium]
MKTIKSYDIVIIGGGPGGYTAAIRAALKGAGVAVVEADKLGGVCLNSGCIPSKALIASALLYDRLKNASAMGLITPQPPGYDWPTMQQRKDKIVSSMVGGIGQLFKSHGVTHFKGRGRLTSRNQVSVIDDQGEGLELQADNIIIATGSRSRDLAGLAIDGRQIVTTDHLLQSRRLPESILIVGAGVIGCEWAFMLSMLDVKVTLVEMLDSALPMEDVDVSRLIERELKKRKIKLYTGTGVTGVEVGPDQITAHISPDRQVPVEQVLVAVGRAFNTEGLGLSDVGVQLNDNGSIATGEDMRTDVDNVYAVGDVRGEIMLAYTAVHDGEIAVDNALGGNRRKDYAGVPSVIFTHPEVASVGLTEARASENHDIAVGRFPMRALGKAHAENEIAGEVKIIADRDTDKILGVHIVGAHATEIIHTAALALRQGMTARELGAAVFGHPVISESIMEAAHDVHGMSVHVAKKPD